MKLREIVEKLNLKVKCGADKLDREITGGYVSDLLSDVIANSKTGDLWITFQVHENVVAVASLNNLAGILLINGREPAEETKEKAKVEGIPIMVGKMSAFEAAGILYKMLTDVKTMEM